MLTFEQKLQIIESFPELTRKDVSLKRVNFHFEDSISDKKNVVFHLHPNGNGFVYAGELEGYHADDKGMVNIRDFSEMELRAILEKSISSLSGAKEEEKELVLPTEEQNEGERWMDGHNHTLILKNEDDVWNIYTGVNLEETFATYDEAVEYLMEEGFSLSR